MLDDFKSVLQRLGGSKLDGTTAEQETSLNLEANKSKSQTENSNMGDSVHAKSTNSGSSHRQRLSLSGRLLLDGEDLDSAGRSRRRQSMAASAVGSIGVKIRKLNHLPFLHDSGGREARQNMERNQRVTSPEEPRSQEANPRRDSTSSREPWDRVDFITALVDPEVEESAR
jgi:hypothetical protein